MPEKPSIQLLHGDCLIKMASLPSGSVDAVITSPPYFGLRDYGVEGQIGLEATPQAYVCRMVEVFAEVWRVLKDDGTLWLNIGDSYASAWACSRRNVIGNGSLENGKREDRPNRLIDGLKEKDLIGIPWRVAFALQEAGWYLRSEIIWHKPNPMPESVTDRPTKSHEQIFLLAKSHRYYYDYKAIKEPSTWKRENNPDWQNARAKTNTSKGIANRNAVAGGFCEWKTQDGRNKRSVWTQATSACKGAHIATFPPDLIRPCVCAGCRPAGTVLDPFFGAGTTGVVCVEEGRNCIGIDLNQDYLCLAQKRIDDARSRTEALLKI